MVVVLDSEYVFKGIMERSIKWHQHGWRVKSKDIGHGLSRRPRTSSCMKARGTDKVDALAVESSRQRHPNEKKQRSKEPSLVAQLWEDVGSCPMRSDVSSLASFRASGGTVETGQSSSGGGGGGYRRLVVHRARQPCRPSGSGPHTPAVGVRL